MTSPQLENGYLKIANEIYDHLSCFRIPGEVRLVVDAIIRKTYGYNKKDDVISNSQLIQMTGLRKGNLHRSLDKAVEHRIVIKKDNRLSFNKRCEEWVPFVKVIKSDNKRPVIKKETKVIKKDNKKLSEVRDTKYNKDNIQKTVQKISDDISEKEIKIKDMLNALSEARGYPITNWGAEGQAAKKAIRIGYTIEDIVGCYHALAEQPFWYGKPISMATILNNVGVWKKEHAPKPPEDRSADAYLEAMGGDNGDS